MPDDLPSPGERSGEGVDSILPFLLRSLGAKPKPLVSPDDMRDGSMAEDDGGFPSTQPSTREDPDDAAAR